MDELLKVLSNITAASALEFLIATAVIISAIVTITIKLYQIFEKFRKARNEEEARRDKLEEVCEAVKDLKDKQDLFIETSTKIHESSKVIDTIQMRHALVQDCEAILRRKYVTKSHLRSIEELYGVYSGVLNANGYVKDLVDEVRQLRKQIDLKEANHVIVDYNYDETNEEF